MKVSLHLPSRPARSKAIFLAAQPVRKEVGPSDSLEQIQEAVIGLARAVFSRKGTLVMAGPVPLLSLILTVAADYWELETETGNLAGVIRAPLIRIFAAGDEEIDGWWLGSGILSAEHKRASLAEAFSILVEQTRPHAMICLGGEGGVYEQAFDFRASALQAPIFVVESTRGDAERIRASMDAESVDQTLIKRLNEAWRSAPLPVRGEIGIPQIYRAEVIPYPLLMQEIVARFLDEK